MRPRDISATLDSMTVLVDTREQDTPRAQRRYEQIGMPIEREALSFGDYSYRASAPGGRIIHGDQLCAIERKMDLDELAQCFTRYRDRFEREWQRAAYSGAVLWLLVEGASWADIYAHRYQTLMDPAAMVGSILAWQCRYQSRVLFCPVAVTGHLIADVLRYDLLERLKRGDYG